MGPFIVVAVPPWQIPFEAVAEDKAVVMTKGQNEANEGPNPLSPSEPATPSPSLPPFIVEYDTEPPLPKANERSHCPIHLLHFPRSIGSDD